MDCQLKLPLSHTVSHIGKPCTLHPSYLHPSPVLPSSSTPFPLLHQLLSFPYCTLALAPFGRVQNSIRNLHRVTAVAFAALVTLRPSLSCHPLLSSYRCSQRGAVRGQRGGGGSSVGSWRVRTSVPLGTFAIALASTLALVFTLTHILTLTHR